MEWTGWFVSEAGESSQQRVSLETTYHPGKGSRGRGAGEGEQGKGSRGRGAGEGEQGKGSRGRGAGEGELGGVSAPLVRE